MQITHHAALSIEEGANAMIRIAIVGTGNISHAHVEAYLRFPERCKIVALVDIVPEKAQGKSSEILLLHARE